MLPEVLTGQTEAVSERRSNEVIAVNSDESVSRGCLLVPITIEDSEAEVSRKREVQQPLQPMETGSNNTSKTEPIQSSDLATKPADVSVTVSTIADGLRIAQICLSKHSKSLVFWFSAI